MTDENWRDGFLVNSRAADELMLEYCFNYQDNKDFWASQSPLIRDVIAIGNRLDSEICEFQAELINGKIFAGRTPCSCFVDDCTGKMIKNKECAAHRWSS